jgi:hypothetical protein
MTGAFCYGLRDGIKVAWRTGSLKITLQCDFAFEQGTEQRINTNYHTLMWFFDSIGGIPDGHLL